MWNKIPSPSLWDFSLSLHYHFILLYLFLWASRILNPYNAATGLSSVFFIKMLSQEQLKFIKKKENIPFLMSQLKNRKKNRLKWKSRTTKVIAQNIQALFTAMLCQLLGSEMGCFLFILQIFQTDKKYWKPNQTLNLIEFLLANLSVVLCWGFQLSTKV